MPVHLIMYRGSIGSYGRGLGGGQREQRSWATAGCTGRPGELITVTFGVVIAQFDVLLKLMK